ncbi:MAG: serine/threonine protein kinase [Planctomycetales bacterium]|nr:serine/threonine protein kinase [Planctomycetales bacterium]
MSRELKPFSDTNRYRPVRVIAEGGMGTVFEAVQYGAEGFEKTVALKTILEEFSRDPEFTEMFVGEAKLVADLVHQNIVQIYQLGKLDRQYYIAMEFIHGVNLEKFMDRHFEQGKMIPVDLCTYIVSRVARGLEYAHNKSDGGGNSLGVVHRDVSPKNVLLSFEGVVKLTDFGIAKAANYFRNREGEVLLGKVQYMSPEQAQYKETDKRSDIFSLGIVLYEMLTGRVLFGDEDTMVTLDNVCRKAVPPIKTYNPDVPDDVQRILGKSLERDLTKRYQDAGEMAYELEYYMYHDRFGPTLVTLEKYLRDLFPELYEKRPEVSRRALDNFNPDTVIIRNEDLIQ